MEKFQLQIFLNIIGIGSASGLWMDNQKLYLISDNSSYLYEYCLAKDTLNKIALTENTKENIPKKDKPDLESITKIKEKIYLFGSATADNRLEYFTYNLENQKVENYSLKNIVSYFCKEFNIPKDEINIEGVVYHNDYIYFFQRGNGKNKINGIFKFHNFAKDKPQFIPIKLPKINKINATFTDAILVQDKIYFLAAAEDSNSTYFDGEVAGSMLGILNVETFEIENTIIISTVNKMEGITFYQENKESIEFLLCEDDDTEKQETIIYKLILEKKF